MPRTLRIEFDNAWYHVMNRGGGQKNIFHNDKHRLCFLDLMNEIHEKFAVETHSYCLMDNHYHLLLRTPEANLNEAMRYLGGIYTQRFNRSQKSDGPLFRGRYKAIVIDADNYLLRVSRYIHRNPIEAKMVKSLKNYRWSSFGAFGNSKLRPNWLHTDEILRRMTSKDSISVYDNFVNNSQLPSLEKFYASKRLPGVLGSTGFVEKLKLKAGYSKKWHPTKRPKIPSIVATVSKRYKVDDTYIYETKRGYFNLPRAMAMLNAQYKYCYSIAEIASHFGVAESTVSATIYRLKKRDEFKFT